MASLGHLFYVLASLLNPVIYLLYGHDHFISKPAEVHHEIERKALFVFGDSLFDPGNNQYLPNVTEEDCSSTTWPYGETFFHHPNGRFCDGRIVPDFIATFANLSMLPPYLQPGPNNYTDGASFASAGAGVLVETDPGTINLPLQLSYFKNVTELLQERLGDDEAKSLLESAVYLISMGGNDYFTFYQDYQNATESQQQEFVGIVIRNLTIVLQGIYDLGGRKIAFQNAGPLGCLPSAKQSYDTELTLGCVEGLQSLARQHNVALAKALEVLESQLTGFKYSIFEYYGALYDRVLEPEKYGFKDGIDACCGAGAYRGSDCGGLNGTVPYELCSDPGESVWFDGSHTSERANLQLAKLIWSGPPNVTGPYNVQQLFEQD